MAHAAEGRRRAAGAARAAGDERRRGRDPHLVLGRRQGHRRDQRRRRSWRAGDDVRLRCAAVEALRLLRCGRPEGRAADHGGAREAAQRQGQRRDPRRQPERAEPSAPRSGREGRSGQAPRHQDRRRVQSHRDAAGRDGGSHPRQQRVSGDHRLGDDRRLAAVRHLAADRAQSREAEGRVGGRDPGPASVRRQGRSAGAARAVRLHLGSRRRHDDLRQGAEQQVARERGDADGAGAGEQGEPRRLGASVEGVGLHRRRSRVSQPPRALPRSTQ